MKIFNKKWISCLFLAVVTVEYSSHKIQAMDLGLEKWTKTWTPASLLPCGLAASYVSKNFLYEPVKKICDSVREYAPQSWKPWITPETMGSMALNGGLTSVLINMVKEGKNRESYLYAAASLGLVLVDTWAREISQDFLYEPAKKICDSVREYVPQSWKPWITPETMGKMAWLGGGAAISYYAYNGHNAYSAGCDEFFKRIDSGDTIPSYEYRACKESPVITLCQFLPAFLGCGLAARGEPEQARWQLEQIRRWGEENEPIRQQLEQIGQGQEQIMQRIEQFTQRRAGYQGRMRQQEQELQRIAQDQEIIGQRREELGQLIRQRREELRQYLEQLRQQLEQIRQWGQHGRPWAQALIQRIEQQQERARRREQRRQLEQLEQQREQLEPQRAQMKQQFEQAIQWEEEHEGHGEEDLELSQQLEQIRRDQKQIRREQVMQAQPLQEPVDIPDDWTSDEE